MTIYFNDILPSLVYGLAAILLVILIILAYRLIKTLDKVDRVVDDVNTKSRKLNGVFDIIDNTADGLSHISDSLVNMIANTINSFFKKNNKKGGDMNE